MPELALVHLVWKAAGDAPLLRFVRAYRERSAGVDHDLVAVFNGFGGTDLERPREVLDGLAVHELHAPRVTLDIPAYFWAARQLDHRYVCFVNSYSEPLADGWLGMLAAAMRNRQAGAVAATGSWESMYTNYVLALQSVGQPAAAAWAKHLVRSYRLARYRRDFEPMPNPHLRSNAFIVERATWVEMSSIRITRKEDAWRFESGRRSFTRRIEQKGLDVFVVGRDGIAYPKSEWPQSLTFRSGGQENLLVADNRTRQYADATPEEAIRLRRLAWGDEPVRA